MKEWIERALIKVFAPDETKKRALLARVKLIELQRGKAVWFTPQEIAAVDVDRRKAKRACIQTCILMPPGAVLWFWLFDFRPASVMVISGVGLLFVALSINTWQQTNKQLRTMRMHQTRAHQSFFEE